VAREACTRVVRFIVAVAPRRTRIVEPPSFVVRISRVSTEIADSGEADHQFRILLTAVLVLIRPCGPHSARSGCW
jgi:hypothetical protein